MTKRPWILRRVLKIVSIKKCSTRLATAASPRLLIESSPMARYSSGNYGEMGSALFRIIIDELGYGDHKQRHSTLFEKRLSQQV